MYTSYKNNLQKKLSNFVLFLFVCLFVAAPLHVEHSEDSQLNGYKLGVSSVSASDHVAPAVKGANIANQANGQIVSNNSEDEDGKIKQWIVNQIGSVLLWFGSLAIRLGGSILEFAIDKLVVDMKTYADEIPIASIWTLIRDVCNLAFIFAFLYLGIMTIFDPERAETKRFLSRIIIGALFINFSLMIVQIVVDLGNFFAITLYTQIIATFSITAGSTDITIPGLFMQYTNLSSLFGGTVLTTGGSNPEPLGAGILFSFYIMAFIFTLIAGVVFAYAAFLIIVRFGVLMMIMMASPLLFAGMLFPQTEKFARDMRSKLIYSALYPVVFFFLVFIALRVIQKLAFMIGAANNYSDVFKDSDSVNFGTLVVFFALASFFMMQSVHIANRMSVAGGNWASNQLTNVRKTAQSAIARSAVRAGVRGATLGQYGAGDVAKMQDKMRKSNSRTMRTGAWAMRTLGIEAGIQATHNAKFGGSDSIASKDKEQRDINKARAQTKQVSEIDDSIEKAIVGGSAQSVIDMEQKISSASTEQLLKLLNKYPKGPERERLLANMSNSQFESLMKAKPEDLDDRKKAEIREERAKAVNTRMVDSDQRRRQAENPNAVVNKRSIEEIMSSSNAKDLDAINVSVGSGSNKANPVFENAMLLTTKQIDDMNLTETAKTELKAKRNRDLIDSVNQNGAAGISAIFNHFKEVEAAKLPKQILKNKLSAEYLSTKLLNKIADNDTLNKDDRATIKTNVEDYHKNSDQKTRDKFTKFFDNTPMGNRF